MNSMNMSTLEKMQRDQHIPGKVKYNKTTQTSKMLLLCASFGQNFWNFLEGGKTCDAEWIFKVVEEKYRGELHYPKNCDYFMDPRNIIQHYKSCPLHQSKSNVKGYGLAEMWCFVTQKNDLEVAHPSIVDARAQLL